MSWKVQSLLVAVCGGLLAMMALHYQRHHHHDYNQQHYDRVAQVENPVQQPLMSLPVGTTYQTLLSIPMVGDYTVQLVVTSKRRATLRVRGDYHLDDIINYELKRTTATSTSRSAASTDIEDKDGLHSNKMPDSTTVQFSVQLSEHLKDVLNRCTVSLTEIRYAPQSEMVSVVVSMLYVIRIPVRLRLVAAAS